MELWTQQSVITGSMISVILKIVAFHLSMLDVLHLSAWWTQYFYFQFLFCQSFFMKQTFDGFFSFSFF